MKIALSTDHAGFNLLSEIRNYLEPRGFGCVNYGPAALNENDDYPDYIFPAAESVANGECDLGIICGGSGQGEAMVANRVKGIRCAVYYGPAHASKPINNEGELAVDQLEIIRLSREHNDANMLSLGARFLTWEQITEAIDLWLSTPFNGEKRHSRRIKKIDKNLI